MFCVFVLIADHNIVVPMMMTLMIKELPFRNVVYASQFSNHECAQLSINVCITI